MGDRLPFGLQDASQGPFRGRHEHGEINDLTEAGIATLSFQDPDDINIELTAPLG